MSEQYIKWVSNIKRNDLKTTGSKGASIGAMYNANFPVPQAFVVTTEAFLFFLKNTGLIDKIKEILRRTDVNNLTDLRNKSAEIRELILSTNMPTILENEIIEAYDQFNVDLKGLKDSPGALAILKSAREPVFVSVRNSPVIEEKEQASFAGQHDSFINIKGNNDLIKSVKKVFASVFNARAIFYRKKKGFDDFTITSAIVQKMINSEKSGVVFSKNPINSKNEIIVESVFGLGESLMTGKVKPDLQLLSDDLELISENISEKRLAIIRTASGQTKIVEIKPEIARERVLRTHELKSLAEYANKLEDFFEMPISFEFGIENNEIFILQVRPIQALSEEKEVPEVEGQILAKGLGASGGISKGTIKVIRSVEDLEKVREGDILAINTINPEISVVLHKISGIISGEGGITSHASVISREMSIPTVVGAQDILDSVQEGMEVSVDGFKGRIFSGEVQNKSVEILPVLPTEKTKVKLVIDSPIFASQGAKCESEGVGLVPIEGLISTTGKHPLYYKKEEKLNDYYEILKANLKEITDKFIGKTIWVRTSDLKTSDCPNIEGAPKNCERNPLMGLHGIRFSLKNEDIFRTEIAAVKSLSEMGHKLGIIIPNVVNSEEVKEAKRIFEEEGCSSKIKIGVIIETPAAALMTEEIINEGINFICINISNLTQYTLATDKCNDEASYVYNEMHPVVLKLISDVIKLCNEKNIESSVINFTINPEIIKFLVNQNTNSISVTPEEARTTSEQISAAEKGEEIKENEQEKETNEESGFIEINENFMEEERETNEESNEEPESEEETAFEKSQEENEEEDQEEIINENEEILTEDPESANNQESEEHEEIKIETEEELAKIIEETADEEEEKKPEDIFN